MIDIAYRLRRWTLGRLRWPTRGVKVMVFDPSGGLLLIRNRYGRSDLWVLPGGGMHRGEAPETAARREVREETGCVLVDCTASGVFRSTGEGRRDTIHLFHATTPDRPAADAREVAEAGFFALNALPPSTSPATRRRIVEWSGDAPAGGAW